MDFRSRLRQPGPILLDGAMGTMLFQKLPGFSGCFEKLNLDNPGVIGDIHRAYIDAGAELILANSFGGSRIKLEEYGLAGRCAEINEAAARVARKAAAGKPVFVAGSVGSSGKLLAPMGELGVDEAYESFAVQAGGLARGGADLILIETMTDLQEAKIALLAARDRTGLPVVCSMSFEESGRTVTGSDMLTALATLAEYGADAVGANCSMGPEGLFRLYSDNISRLRELCVPLTVWANAGMPEFVDGRTVYRLAPDDYARESARFCSLGLKIIGGCCGTTPAHISALKRDLEAYKGEIVPCEKSYRWVTSRFSALDMAGRKGLVKVGERLNPTARKKFAEELKAGQTVFLRDESRKQEAEGADILDINVGVPGIDEVSAMERCIGILSNTVKIPLMIDTDNYRVLERGLLCYPGVPVINSINAKKKSLETLVPLLKRFGSFVVALCMDETGIHQESGKRIAIGERLLEALAAEGIDPQRVLIDPLQLAESAEPGSAVETLKVIAHFAGRGIMTSVGLSNISFGLPQRKHVNNAFLNMAMEKGLSAAIINTASARVGGAYTDEETAARDFLEGRDPRAAVYIQRFGQQGAEKAAPAEKRAPGDALAEIFDLVVEGDSDAIAAKVASALERYSPEEVMNGALIRGLEKVGDYYSAGEFFLPQMIASAQAMKTGFERLKPLLKKDVADKKGTVVICTVRGDVHDIGKNIVAMMLENHGFDVVDLGKDVEAERIVAAVKETGARILCLSSLLTTTMGEMAAISDVIKKEKLPVTLIVGGAVVTRDYAEKIGALYGEDAVEGVRMANSAAGKK
jgi:5-methyltetrahydrofolate--homocysteine methyltransferase